MEQGVHFQLQVYHEPNLIIPMAIRVLLMRRWAKNIFLTLSTERFCIGRWCSHFKLSQFHKNPTAFEKINSSKTAIITHGTSTILKKENNRSRSLDNINVTPVSNSLQNPRRSVSFYPTVFLTTSPTDL